MARKVIPLEFIVPTVLAITLGGMLTIGAVYLTAVYLTDHYVGPVDQRGNP